MRPMLLFDKKDIEDILTGQMVTIHTGGASTVLITLDPEVKRKKPQQLQSSDASPMARTGKTWPCRYCHHQCGTAGGRGMHEKVHVRKKDKRAQKALVHHAT